MNAEIRAVGSLTAERVEGVLTAAIAAPSLHNSQPWRFHCTPTTIDLYADLSRELPAADPDHRELYLACGAALLNLRLAIRVAGSFATVSLLPDARRPDLLAVVKPTISGAPSRVDRGLAAAVPRRHTNRRPFLPEPVPPAVVGALRKAARAEQAWLAPISGAQRPILRALVTAAHDAQRQDPAFVAEWSHWTGRDGTTTDGVPARAAGPRPEPQDEWVLRDFSAGQARQRVDGKDFEPRPLIAVIGSFHDLPLARLQAGQAMQRVLLTATEAGLSASFLSQVVEVPAARRQLRDLIGGGLWPQTVLRIGYGSPVPATPRRDLHEVVVTETAVS
ncbi:MAG TPA: nitroreductase family protein [Pseudonocardiaceae bacterium]|nr:nitroreductase family protein [Pseudonocardiaceae bacterium]